LAKAALSRRRSSPPSNFNLKRILYVAYPLSTVSDESCGGAEQILFVLQREMFYRGHHPTVAACTGSRVTGELLDTGAVATQFEQLALRDAQHNAAVAQRTQQRESQGNGFDLLHDHGGRFWTACSVDVPVLVTLHLSRSNYPPDVFNSIPENVFFNCVSQTQMEQFRELPQVLGVVRNGVPLDRFPFTIEKEPYLVCLGRICEDKGVHLALDAAERAGVRLIVVGPGYLYARDQEYFDREIAPRLARNPRSLFVPSPTFKQKIELLRYAQGLLMPSQMEETSSLVCIEAMACGTPAIAFRRGALPEVIVDGETGFIVDSVKEMSDAIHKLADITLHACRTHVEMNHSAARMASDYELLYDNIAARFGSDARTQAVVPADPGQHSRLK
jgi:glycosyltransferase involved in cell wall biosynthesis